MILYGPSGVGKYGVIRWALRNEHDIKLVKIDCEFHKSESLFIEEMISQMKIGNSSEEELSKKIVMNEEVRLCELNPFIKKHKQKYVFVIKNA